jgi:hypothetical protein
VLATGAAFLWVRAYLAGPEPRNAISRATSRFLGVEGEYADLNIEGYSAHSAGYAGTGLQFVRKIRADNVAGKLNPAGLFKREWSVPEIAINRLTLDVYTERTLRAAEETPVAPPRNTSGWWRSILPNRFQLDQLRVGEITVRWTTSKDAGEYSGSDVRAQPRGRTWLVEAGNGKLAFPRFPTFDVTAVRFLWSKEQTDIERLELATEGNGRVAISGKLGETHRLKIKATNVDLQSWIPKSAHAQLSGRLDCDTDYLQAPNKPLELSGTVSFNAARLRNHDVMDKVAQYTRMPQYRDMVFQVAVAQFTSEESTTNIEKLEIESRGLLRIEGAGKIVNETIDAEMDVGVPVTALRYLPGAGSQVFTVERDGYRWAHVKVKGPLANPEQDLVARLIDAPFNMVLGGLTGTLTDGVADAVKQTGSGATRILRGGVGVVGGTAEIITGKGGDGLGDGTKEILNGAGDILNIFNPFSGPSPEEQRR